MAIDIGDSYFYKLHILKSVSDTVFDHLLRFEVGIGLSHFILLATIHRYQPASQQQIAKYLDVTAGAISRQVDTAQNHGWITVENDKTDRRKQLVILTPKGEELFTKGDACLLRAGDRIFTDKKQRHEFVATLEAIKKRIDAVAPTE